MRLLFAAFLVAAVSCGQPPDEEGATEVAAEALTAQDVMGFESLSAWTPSSGTESLSSMHTQGVSAYALAVPVNFTNIVSAAIDNTAPNLQGIASAGSSLALDMVIPTQQPNPSFLGSVQLSVSVPSRSVFNLFLAQVELTGLPLGTFQTLHFAVPDSLRTSLRGATFSDLTFTVALNAPSGATGTYIFDNLRVLATNNADFALTPNPTSLTVVAGATATSTITIGRVGGFSAGVALSASGLPSGVTAAFNPATATGASSVVTFTAASNAAVGPATVTITGTGGGLSRTATVSLTVAPAPTFTLSASPASVSVVQGATAQSTVSIARQNGFASAVTFSASGLPSGVTAAFNPASTTGGSSVVTFTAGASAALGTSTVTITGSGGGLSRTTTIALTVTPAPTFTLSASPASVSVVQGTTAQSTVSIARQNGFAAAVALSASGLPSGVTAAFNPASVTGTSSVVTFAAGATATIGTATITIAGTGGGLTRTTTIAVTVVAAPDFALSASPASVTVIQGAVAQSTVTIAPLNGFAAAVSFAAGGLPAGVTATFAPSTTAGPSTVVTFTASSGAALGSATVTITGTAGSLVRTTSVSLTVAPPPDFALSANPTSVTVIAGSTAQSTLTIAPINGFNAAVSFAASGLPAGVTATFAPPATAGPSAVVTFAASTAAALGTVPITIVGTAGSLTRTVALTLTVAPAPDFALAAVPGSVTVALESTATTVLTVTPLNGFAGSVSFGATGLPTGVTATFNPPAAGDSTVVTFSASTAAALGTTNLTITGTNGSLIRTTAIALTVASPSGDFSLTTGASGVALTQGDAVNVAVGIARVDGFPSTIFLTAAGLPSGVTATFTPASTTADGATLTLSATALAVTGPTTVTLTGSGGGLVRTATLDLTVNPAPTGDFSLSASPTGVAITQGDFATTTVAIARTDGFADAVTFTAAGLPAGVGATFTPSSTADDSVTLTLTAAANAAAGSVTVTVTGTGGGLTRTTTVDLTVDATAAGDFDLAASPDGFALGQGDSASGQVLVTPLGGFGGTIVFSAGGLPSGVTATFSPPVSTGSAVQVTFTAAPNAVTGPATVAITGTSGTLSHSVPVSLLVNPAVAGDFDLVASRSGFGLSAGDQTSGLIIVERSGLSAAVAFSVSGLPPGVTASFSPPTTSGDQTILTLTVAPEAPSSFSTITVTGAAQPGGNPARTVDLTLLVNGS
jgi:uncharacterized membrane protein